MNRISRPPKWLNFLLCNRVRCPLNTRTAPVQHSARACGRCAPRFRCPSGAVFSGRRAETARRRSGRAEPPVWLRLVSSLNTLLSDETKQREHASNHGAAALARGSLFSPAWWPGKPGHHARTRATPGRGNAVRRAGARRTARTSKGSRASPPTARRVAAQAQCPHVRALCAAIPARSPLLPALTRSFRAASAFLTSLPHKAETVRSGTLHLYYTSKQTGGRTNPETHWGTRNPPGPKNTARFQVPQTPPTSPKDNDRPRRTHHRGKAGGPRYRPHP
jgi:hypothetical protein